jgi:hypothetical protein
MKLWLTKWRISSALDSGRPLPELLRARIAADPELSDFARRLEALDSRLRRPQLAESNLHDGIMRAVRSSTSRPQLRPAPGLAVVLGAPVAVVMVLALLLWSNSTKPAPPAQISLDAPLAILDMSEAIQARIPPAMMAPLTNELAKVDHDLRSTRDIVTSTFPF